MTDDSRSYVKGDSLPDHQIRDVISSTSKDRVAFLSYSDDSIVNSHLTLRASSHLLSPALQPP